MIDEALRRSDAEVNAAFPAKPGGPLTRRMSVEALNRIIRAEGREVLTPAADGYWRDQEKRFPEIKARQTNERRLFNGFGDRSLEAAAARRMRLVNGKWMERVRGEWREVSRRGAKAQRV